MGLLSTVVHNHLPKQEPVPPRLATYDAISILRQLEEEARNRVLGIYRPEGNQVHCTVVVERGDFEILAQITLYINGHKYDVPLRFGDNELAAADVLVEHVREVIVRAITGHVIEDVLRGLLPVYKGAR